MKHLTVNIKSFFAFFAAVVLSVSLCACAGSSESKQYIDTWVHETPSGSIETIILKDNGKGTALSGDLGYDFTWSLKNKDGENCIEVTNPQNNQTMDMTISEQNGKTVLIANGWIYYREAELDSASADEESANISSNTDTSSNIDIPQNSNQSQSSKTDSKTLGNFDEEAVLSQLQVQELSHNSRFANKAFLIITNNSDFDLSIDVDALFYDENGSRIAAKSASLDAVESTQPVVVTFSLDEEYATMDYELSVEPEDFYECVYSDLSYEASEAKNKIVLSVTNNGSEAAEFVQAEVLFFMGNEVVSSNFSYFTDDDFELKPGETIHEEINCYEDFDSYQVFLSGRR